MMKKAINSFGIIALVAIIGFTLVISCGGGDPDCTTLGHDHTGSLLCKRCGHKYAIGDTGPGGGIIFWLFAESSG